MIRSVAVSGTDVYVVGSFTTAGGVIVNNVAKWNGTAWSALGLGVPGGFLNAVAVSGNNVYVAGNFQSAGGTAANNIARWNGSTWQQLGSGIPNGVVFSLAVAGNDVYAGGSFTNAGTTAANRIAKWNGTTWSGLNSAIVNDVTTIVPAGNVIYVGTSTTTVDSPNYFLKYDGTTWTPLGTGMTGGGVSSIALVGSDIYVAGGFTGVGGITTPQIAKFDGTNWSALGAGLPNGGFGGSNVVRLATIGSDLFAVGDFNVATGGPGNRIAKWNGTSWSRLGDGLNNNGLAVAAAGDSVFVGGEFIAAGCNISPFFARWRQTLWTGTINSDWHNPGNWGSGSVPPSNVGVTIDTNSASITSADVALSSLIVKNGRTLNVGPNRTLTVTGNVFLENGNLAGTGNLIVNGDLILNDASIIDFSSVVVNGNLVLNNGSISGPGIVSLTACRPGAMIGGNSVSFIASPFSRCVDSSGVYRFPVGTGLVYSPAELTNITGSGNFTVNARAGAYSNTANGLPANRLLRWWNLTNGGVTRANVTVDYQQADIVGAERQYRAFSIAGGNAVRIPALLNQATNRAVVSGVTSSFALTLAEIDSENVTMTGRLTSNRGRGAEYVVVTLTDSLGVSRITQTNQSGYFRFPNVATFQVYTVTVRSKKFTFTAPQRAVDFDELTGDVNFVSTDH